jgi:transcriptional regulator with XRE-family HTH domain
MTTTTKPRPPGRAKLGERLRRHRIRAKLSQEAVAKAIGLYQPDVSAHESGRRNVSMDVLMRYARALDTTISNLLDGINK